MQIIFIQVPCHTINTKRLNTTFVNNVALKMATMQLPKPTGLHIMKEPFCTKLQ